MDGAVRLDAFFVRILIGAVFALVFQRNAAIAAAAQVQRAGGQQEEGEWIELVCGDKIDGATAGLIHLDFFEFDSVSYVYRVCGWRMEAAAGCQAQMHVCVCG